MGETLPSVSDVRDNQQAKIKIEEFFGRCFEATRLETGQRIPVGGKNFLSGEHNIEVVGDFENITALLREMDKKAKEIVTLVDLEEMRSDMERRGLPSNIFAAAGGFTKIFEKHFPDNPERSQKRAVFYRAKGADAKLSEIFGDNIAECAEIAALAQKFLQEQGISSSYFSGEVLWEKDSEFSGKHSFIVIRHEGKVFIFDPTNPVSTQGGKFPSIYIVEEDFDKNVRQGKKRLVTAKNIATGREAYFGVGNGTNIDCEQDIV